MCKNKKPNRIPENERFVCKHCGETGEEKFRIKYGLTICIPCYRKQGKQLSKDKKNRPKRNFSPDIIDRKLTATKRNCKLIGREFSINRNYIEELLIQQENKCYYSGLVFDNESRLFQMSIDRTDSNQGYIVGNIKLVCACVNYMKQSYSEETFLHLVKLINNKHNLK